MILKYDKETNTYNNLNCGRCFKIKVNDKWKNVRIELAKDWYLIDEDGFTCNCSRLEGCEIDID